MSGHSCCWSGQITLLGLCERWRATTFVAHGTGLTHAPALSSHLVPWGQQWMPSAQHIACGLGQQPYFFVFRIWQQVVPSGHSMFESGHLMAVPPTGVFDARRECIDMGTVMP
ncbi:hypothetical protein NP493_364g02073 [Ridgeia piscesae]|uniref:Uncharacterized protein n=1 Tax=Ridgeia piscesae TaxID=27915 RepID=A0AAD9L3J5_RIDPI|nr:hypothetical protein NP493_364g02073 [Ridgeia piscesae]